MKLTIRNGVFETNSSSIHTLVLSTSKSISELEESAKNYKVNITGDEFGWGWDVLVSSEEKLNYLWSFINGIYNYKDGEYDYTVRDFFIDDFKKMLDSCEISYEINKYSDSVYCLQYGIIDHNNDWYNYLEPERINDSNCVLIDIIHDKNKFLNYIFNDNSVIIIANDNDDFDVRITEIINDKKANDSTIEVFKKEN